MSTVDPSRYPTLARLHATSLGAAVSSLFTLPDHPTRDLTFADLHRALVERLPPRCVVCWAGTLRIVVFTGAAEVAVRQQGGRWVLEVGGQESELEPGRRAVDEIVSFISEGE